MNNRLSFLDHQHTVTSSYNPQRASPYTINSPRTNRRQGMRFYTIWTYKNFFFSYIAGGMPHQEVNHQCVDVEDENTRPVQFNTINHKVFDMLLQRCDSLENEVRSLQGKMDKLLKMARNSIQDEKV
jgi:hypothetical protein